MNFILVLFFCTTDTVNLNQLTALSLAERCLLLDVPRSTLSVATLVRCFLYIPDPAALTSSSICFVGLPRFRLTMGGCHSSNFPYHWPTDLRAMCPDHYHLSLSIILAMSLVLLWMSSCGVLIVESLHSLSLPFHHLS